MADPLILPAQHSLGHRLRGALSTAALLLAAAVLAATFLLLSPPADQTYPGALPWREGSILRGLVEVLALAGAVQTARGVEVKDLAFHLGAAVALLLLAARAWVSGRWPPERATSRDAWFFSQIFLWAWVGISATSAFWSGDAEISLGQAALYAMALAWAFSLSWSVEGRDVPRILTAYVALAAAAAGLCVWYYYERNPFHRPGFPIGNPGALASCLLPAAILGFFQLWAAIPENLRRLTGRDAGPQGAAAGPPRLAARLWVRMGLVCLALVLLVWALWLAGSRASLVGAVIAVGGILFIRAGARLRLALLFSAVLLAAAGVWLTASHSQELAMARGATIRFRIYAWQYAALLWSHRPISGIGAGSFPRLATAMSTTDRALDPAAFMAELVEHAHNELFEVFAEIGLIGGVTFVAGWLAALAAGARLLSSSLSPERRATLLGLMTGLLAILGDSLFSVGTRLPGPAAVQFTLLGCLWAMCRATSKVVRPASAAGTTLSPATVAGVRLPAVDLRALRRTGLAAAALACAAATSWLALRNWSGALAERRGYQAMRDGQPQAALALARRASPRLLDPVRKLTTDELAVRAAMTIAQRSFDHWQQARAAGGESPSVPPELHDEAVAAAEQALHAAAALNQRAPTFARMAAAGARALEWLAELHRQADPQRAVAYSLQAFQAWRSQRAQRPYDQQTLLALLRYPAPASEKIGLLRDALREGPPVDEWPEWQAALAQQSAAAEFDATLRQMLDAARPYGPEAEAGSLMVSMSPEMFRTAAAWHARRGEYEAAAAAVEHAAALYRALRSRLPDRLAVALGEQAEYELLARPDEPHRAVELLEAALAALPIVQAQKMETARRPYLLRLARARLAAGDEPRAREALAQLAAEPGPLAEALASAYTSLAQRFIRRPPDARPPVEAWLRAAVRHAPTHVPAWAWLAWLAAQGSDSAAVDKTLAEAAASGVSAHDLERIRASLRLEFPPTSQPP